MEQKKSDELSPADVDDKPDCPTCLTGEANPAHTAAFAGHIDCVKFVFRTLKDTRILLDLENNSPLHAAVAGGRVDILKYLLQFTRIPVQYQNNHGETCVHIAALRHKLECVKILLSGSFKKTQNYASIKDRLGCTVLHYAVLVNDNDVALWLLQRFGKNLANISNDDGVLPLHVAAAQGNIEFIRIATKYDVHMVNKRDRNGATAIFYAVQSGYLQCLKYLVEKAKADVHTLTSRGQSLLHAACLNGHAAIVQWLFTKMEKSAVYQQTNDAATTFHCASYGGHVVILKMLHKVAGNKRFAVNSTDRRGNTSLHLAALNGYLDCVQFLLQLGAEARVRNMTGQTVIDVADKRGHPNVVACLTASVLGSKESMKKKYVRHKSHGDASIQADDVRPNSLSTSGYSSGAAASDGYGRTALPLNSLHYNEPSSGYASSSDKGTKENSTETTNKVRVVTIAQTAEGESSLDLKNNWLLRRRRDNETKDNDDKIAGKSLSSSCSYGILHHSPIELISPRQSSTTYGGPVVVHREVQTDFDPLEDNIIIVNEQEQIIFSSVPSIPTIFSKSQQKLSINQLSEAATTTNNESESSKKLKKRRRKPSPRERKKLQAKTVPDSSFWSTTEMQERKRSVTSLSSSSSDISTKVVVHTDRNRVKESQTTAFESSSSQNRATIYAGIAAAERIDEYLKGELEAMTDSDSNGSGNNGRRKKGSNVTTAVAIVHKSSDEIDNCSRTLDCRPTVVSCEETLTIDRRPSDLGPALTLPVFYDPLNRRRSAGDIQIDTTLDVKSFSKYTDPCCTIDRTMSSRSDRSLSIKSASLGDLNDPQLTSSNKPFTKPNLATNSLINLCGSVENRQNLISKSVQPNEEYGTLRGPSTSQCNLNREDSWLGSNSHQSINDFGRPPPAPPLPSSTTSVNTSVNSNRLFHKRSAATAFKVRDKILSDHLKTSNSTDTDDQTIGRKTVSEIRRQLEDKLNAHPTVHTGDNNAKSTDSLELQTAVCNENVFAPIKNTLSVAANSYQQNSRGEDKNVQVQSFRYFGTSNASDYALRGRINEIIRLGVASVFKQSENKICEDDEDVKNDNGNETSEELRIEIV